MTSTPDEPDAILCDLCGAAIASSLAASLMERLAFGHWLSRHAATPSEVALRQVALAARHAQWRKGPRRVLPCDSCPKVSRTPQQGHRHWLSKHAADQGSARAAEDFRVAERQERRGKAGSRVCDQCGKGKRDGARLLSHMELAHVIRERPELLDCEECGKTAKSRDTLLSHWLRCHTHRPSEMRTLRKIQNALKRRQRNKPKPLPRFNCDTCEAWRVFRSCSRKAMLGHMARNHSLEGVVTTSVSSCEDCGSSHASRDLTLRHILSCHTVEGLNVQKAPKPPVHCDECSWMGEKGKLRGHLSSHNLCCPPLPVGIKIPKARHLCENCGASLTSLAILVQHSLGHAGRPEKLRAKVEEDTKCDECGAALARGSLLLHWRLRHGLGTRPLLSHPKLNCDQCGGRFFRSRILGHLPGHEAEGRWGRRRRAWRGTRTFRCDQCAKTHPNPDQMARHQKRHGF